MKIILNHDLDERVISFTGSFSIGEMHEVSNKMSWQEKAFLLSAMDGPNPDDQLLALEMLFRRGRELGLVE